MAEGIFIVGVGNAFDGMSHYGPFFSTEDAGDFVDTLGHSEWYIRPLMAPMLSIDAESEAVGLFSGPVPDLDGETEALVTLWPDGTVELALRANPTHSWGPPVTLESKETR